jgi:single-strand DNA-binding protein
LLIKAKEAVCRIGIYKQLNNTVMEITGRLTADARVSETKNNKKVVGFSLAINDTFRKDGEQKKVTTYVDCSYWLNAGIAQYLTKGTVVELYGRMGANAWTNKEGKAIANLTFHINNLKLLGKSYANTTERVTEQAQVTASQSGDDKEDLPF